jgi:hypothetical protein
LEQPCSIYRQPRGWAHVVLLCCTGICLSPACCASMELHVLFVLLLLPSRVNKAGGVKAAMFHAAYAYKQFCILCN